MPADKGKNSDFYHEKRTETLEESCLLQDAQGKPEKEGLAPGEARPTSSGEYQPKAQGGPTDCALQPECTWATILCQRAVWPILD